MVITTRREIKSRREVEERGGHNRGGRDKGEDGEREWKRGGGGIEREWV
jgi:hypothetical protein